MLKDRYSALSNIERRAFWIVLTFAVVLGGFASILFDTLFADPDFQHALVNSIPLILSMLCFTSAILIFFGKKEQGSWLLLLGVSAGLLLGVSQAEGYGLPAAFLLLSITIFVPLQLLKGPRSSTALAVGIVSTVTIILVDTLWTLSRVPGVQQSVFAAQLTSIILGIVLVGAIFAQYPNLALKSKLVILFVMLAILAVSIVSIAISINTRSELTRQVRSTIARQADRVAAGINNNLASQIRLLSAESQNFGEDVDSSNSLYSEDESTGQILAGIKTLNQEWVKNRDYPLKTTILNTRVSDKLRKFQAVAPDHAGVFITDKYGAIIASTNITSDYYQGDKDWWQTAFASGKGSIYIGQPEYDTSSQKYAVTIAIPVFNDNRVVGIMRSTLDVTGLLTLLDSEKFGSTGRAELNLGKDRMLGEPELSASELSALKTLTSEYGVIAYHGVPSLVSEIPLPILESGDPIQNAISNLGWQVIVHQDSSESYEPIAKQTKTTTLIALIVSILAGILGYFVAQLIAAPIVNLTNTTDLIAQGDLNQRSLIMANDEIGTLARAINSMTSQLQDTLRSLERRVAERTADLEMSRLLSERRAQELQSISEISRIISSEQKLETLLTLITQLVSEKFDFYHTGIFLVEDTRQFAVLQASNSEGGQRMLARGHRLEVGHTGIVGNVAQAGKPRIALDVGSDAIYFDNPDLPKTRSEMALPLNLRGVTIGVLDVQSVKPGAFTENDAKTLSILADQIAIAIDNARLFGKNQQTLTEVQSLYNQYLRQEWSTFSKHETRIGYVQSMMGGKPLEHAVDSEAIRNALQKGEVTVINGNGEKSLPSMVVPVKLRGQTIGVLNIKAPTQNRQWNKDEINLAQAISDRLALALDNARLLFESQRQTAKEQKIGEVTAKIGASINMRNVLQTAVEELGRALPGSEVVIQFQSNGKQE